SVAVVERLSGCLRALGAELAEPGGFTRRALDNGRMDLTQVEGLADLIDAETEAQRSQAQWVAEGGLSEVIEGWRAKLVRARALCEAVIDFADEDVPVDVSREVRALVETSMAEMTARLRGSAGAQEVRQGFDVALVGLPNSGKSTLVNAIAGREVALTSPIAGTTRDVLEVRLNLKGLPVRVLDLAGVRETDDQVEGLGVSRAMERARAAPLRIFLMDEKGQLPEGLERRTSDILVQGKADLGGHGVSGLTGQGLDQLLEAVYDRLKDRVLGDERLTRDRHVVALEACRANLCVALGLLGDGGVEDLIAEELRAATQCLDRIIGRVDVEDLLDVVFQSFCIGK
ncbi:MAG: GTPase, partial [Pseudomonadota bacterium]